MCSSECLDIYHGPGITGKGFTHLKIKQRKKNGKNLNIFLQILWTERIIAQLLTALVANENGLSVPSLDLKLRMEEDNGGDKKCDGFLTLTCSQNFLWICDVFGNPLMEQQLGNRSCNLFSIFSDSVCCPDDGHVSFMSLVELWRNSGNIKPTIKKWHSLCEGCFGARIYDWCKDEIQPHTWVGTINIVWMGG